MVVLAERRSSRSAVWAGRLARFSAVLFVVSGLGHRLGLIETIGFFWLLGLIGTLAIAALLLAAAGFYRLWTYGERGGISSAWAVLIALVVLAPFMVSAWRVYAYPQLSDISTDIADPPPLDAAEKSRTADMNPVAPISAEQGEMQSEAYPDITGRRYPLSADRVQQLAADLVLANGWKFIQPPTPALAGGDSYMEALAKTAYLAFPVDVSIRITDEGDTSYVDMRSASRYGRHDLGDNAARINDFLVALDAAVAGAAGVRAAEEPPPAPSEVPVPSAPPAD
ncbi:DUF1499 domain-containing protein [Mesorhizobium sp. BAC0120]|uniref:DUF1499 domain-containing protein n=1 Tax=Mesorhizobium sp. BAC0120 TaxID=3090670 RepID=UPI00298C8B39|nr:DUF1499 domain-containing protein [Mesorhizobium sp. BAC0120]MDW6020948.1 DUF1499 domain-containing protein [Mesorhizobium sp. BAC0120]